MSRALMSFVRGLAYAIFFATFLYLVCFVGNLPFAPVTIDRGPESPLAVALIVDLALIAIFGFQHSVMARQGFKRAWTRIVPQQLERSVYVLAASAALIIMFLFWRPIPAIVWEVSGSGEMILWLLFASGWLIVLLSTFLINHFELFGLQQAWMHMTRPGSAAAGVAAALLLSLGRSSTVRGVLRCLLVGSADDRRTFALRARDERLHPHRDPVRGAGPSRPLREGL